MADAVATRIAVTGVNGFVGRHLAAELAGNGIEVAGIGMEPESAVAVDTYFSVDLVHEWPEIGPVDAVIHLAGLAAVGPSFDDPQRYITVNSSIVTHMAEALLGSPTRIVLVSSGAIYAADQPLPLTEDSAIAINSPYAISKILNEDQAAYYGQRGLDCVIARPFNHIGPGQKSGFLLPDLAAALFSLVDEPAPLVEVRRPPAAEASKPPEEEALVSRPRSSAPQPAAPQSADPAPILTGDLTTKRDYTDVRDVVRAYRLLATQPVLQHRVYNICSGVSLSGNDILAALTKGRYDIRTEVDPARLRPNDPAEIVGDNSRLREDTGWSPTLSIDETVADFLAAR